MIKKSESDATPFRAGVAQITGATFRRLPRYHQILAAYEGFGREYISSKELSEMMEINETLVRKDMGDMEIRGRPNQGYPVIAFRKKIEEFLGLLEITDAVLIGAGRLGQALSLYPGFETYGLRIVGLFDSDPYKIGGYVGERAVMSLDELPARIAEWKIKLAILTVPKEVAQGITDVCVRHGVKAIWNFTPSELSVPGDIMVRNEQIVAGFMTLSYYLKNLPHDPSDDPGDEPGSATSFVLGTA